jgi:hypothetical protein
VRTSRTGSDRPGRGWRRIRCRRSDAAGKFSTIARPPGRNDALARRDRLIRAAGIAPGGLQHTPSRCSNRRRMLHPGERGRAMTGRSLEENLGAAPAIRQLFSVT